LPGFQPLSCCIATLKRNGVEQEIEFSDYLATRFPHYELLSELDFQLTVRALLAEDSPG